MGETPNGGWIKAHFEHMQHEARASACTPPPIRYPSSKTCPSSRAKRKGEVQEQLAAQGGDLAKRAGTTMVAADERIRVTSDELGFAEVERGADVTGR